MRYAEKEVNVLLFFLNVSRLTVALLHKLPRPKLIKKNFPR